MKKKKNYKPENSITQPVFPGGKKALQDFIKSELKYPEDALKQKIEGVVKIAYDVDVFGNVNNVHVIKGVGYGCDEEAVRLVSLLKFPKHKYPGMHVVFHQILNITFRIYPAKIQTHQNIVYSLKSTLPDQASGNTITYSITIN